MKKPWCECCGSKKELTVHHVLQKCDYPQFENHPYNKLTLCIKCHKEIHNVKTLDKTRVRKENWALRKALEIVLADIGCHRDRLWRSTIPKKEIKNEPDWWNAGDYYD